MKYNTEVALLPGEINEQGAILTAVSGKMRISRNEISGINVVKRSLDARSRIPVYRLSVDVYVNETPPEIFSPVIYRPVKGDKKVIIVGFGPAGMFAALRLIEKGIRPVVIERGRDVRARRRDLRAIQQEHFVNPDSNYCFGEGGAGTYSDGKLYTRSDKRGDIKKVLNILVQHGAVQDILVDAHPHIGSNKLPKIVQAIRETVLNSGGEIRFESRVTDLIYEKGVVKGVIVNDSEELTADAVILATGHSARDIYSLLDKRGILLEAKSFALGVRIEHPQMLIDEIRYHKNKTPELPAASYTMTCQIDNRGVYSFCMCPGGIIIPASTAADELVLNGMSVSRRDSPFANSGFVAAVEPEDLAPWSEHGKFAGLEYQKFIEHRAFTAGGSSQTAPAQRVTDFLAKRISQSLPKSSYIPGMVSADLYQVLTPEIAGRLAGALRVFNEKMKGYITEEAVMLATESRTSSPVRIPRDKATYMHPQAEGLFPAGEGAGYAGGIVSAAIDGENTANAAAEYLLV